MESVIIIIMLVIVNLQLYYHFKVSSKIAKLLSKIEYGLLGNGYNGALGKLSFLEYIDAKLEELVKK